MTDAAHGPSMDPDILKINLIIVICAAVNAVLMCLIAIHRDEILEHLQRILLP